MTGMSRRNYVYIQMYSGSQILTLLTTDQLVMWPDSFIEAPMHTLFLGVALSLLSQEFEIEWVLWSNCFIQSMIPGSWAVETLRGGRRKQKKRTRWQRCNSTLNIDTDRAGMVPGATSVQ